MKKILLPFAILIMVISTHNAFSQTFKIGIKGGADIKKLTGKSFDDKFSYGYHLGAFTELGLSPKFGIQPEVFFSQVNIDTSSNFSEVYNLNSFSKISKIQLKYISIPILLSYKPNKFVSLQAGPQFGILMDQGNTILQNGKDAFKKGDFSLIAGLQLNISKIRLYGRYAVGLNNLNDIDDRDKWKSQTIQLGLGFTL
ncbi:MAG: porin family protein [Ferruginibacter sp.]